MRGQAIPVEPGQRFNDWMVLRELQPLEVGGDEKQRKVVAICRRCNDTTQVMHLNSLRTGQSRCCRECSGKSRAPRKTSVALACRAVPLYSNDELTTLLNACTAEAAQRGIS